VTLAAGLVLALLSAFALNWGWLEQHGAASALPPLALRRPVSSLAALFRARAWLTGFCVGLVGWALYVAALAAAPLSLVQATSAGGIGLLAVLARRRGQVVPWAPVALAATGLVLLGVSLSGGGSGGSRASWALVLAWLGSSALLALALAPANLGLTAGALYAAGDVATKAAVHRPLFVPLVLAAHGAAFVALQLGFQRGSAIGVAGTSMLVTNALPIAAGVALFHETMPSGPLGAVRVAAFGAVVVAAGLIARPAQAATRTTRSSIVSTLPQPRRNSAS
jgi:hypothetical protein